MRKVNAVISLISTILILVHAIFYSVWMLFRAGFAKMSVFPSRILVVLMMAHAIISIVLAILGHKGADKKKCNNYPEMNKQTYVQRISGVLLILFIYKIYINLIYAVNISTIELLWQLHIAI